MITQINSVNKPQYDELFNKASNALGKEISNLNEYFENLNTLVVEHGLDYARLPLDEECFKIEADTRTIIVPTHFKKNGVGIQGDETAEIIYFKVARYFEITDLAQTKIRIQWKMEDGIEGVSEVWAPNIILDEEDNEFLTFGWVLGKDNITAKSGTATFAISFIIYGEENKVMYQLNTLETQLMVMKNIGVENAIVETGAIANLEKRLGIKSK